jgi:hypothetical protein
LNDDEKMDNSNEVDSLERDDKEKELGLGLGLGLGFGIH